MALVELKDVWEMYRIKFIVGGKASPENFWALRGVSFSVEKGEVLGLIGENGSGKSTILKLISGMLKPDRGSVNVRGRVSGLLELGAGFQPELTGEENIYLSCGMFGLSREETDALADEIIRFADIGKFIHAPVKCYSQGMFVRLAFAVAIHVKPDLLLIDDTLAVGDEFFQKKCIKKIFELKDSGMTIICVSHDLGMLRRLANRLILLKGGRVIRDGEFEKVAPAYTQMTGSQAGTAILEKGGLQAVFNNGKLFLSYKGLLLTSGSGVYANFSVSDTRYTSFQADWKINDKADGRISAAGNFYRLNLIQLWEVEIITERRIKLDIRFFSEDPVEIQEGYTVCMVGAGYDSWFTPLGSGSLPQIKESDSDWQPLLEGDVAHRCIGLSSSAKDIPAIALEYLDSEARGYAQILNSDFLSNCRVLQYKRRGIRNYTSGGVGQAVYFSGGITVAPAELSIYMKDFEDEATVSRGKLRLNMCGGRLAVNYDGKDLTSGEHIFSSFYTGKKWYLSHASDCSVRKTGADTLIAECRWRNLPLVQVWEVGISAEGSLLVKIKMKIETSVEIEQQLFWFIFSKGYERWFSDYGEGDFPGEFIESETDMLSRCISGGKIGLTAGVLPAVSLGFSGQEGNFAKIFNSDFYRRSRILRVDNIQPEKKIRLSAGEYECFDTELSFGGAGSSGNVASLQRDKIKFVFDSGSGHIYWSGRELTKKQGFYTSMRSRGRWYDSRSGASWKIEEASGSLIKASGAWKDLPIVQRWSFELQEEGQIGITVGFRVNGHFEADRTQLNLMLSEQYSNWIAGNKEGSFLEFKNNIDDDWEEVFAGCGGGCQVGVFDGSAEAKLKPVFLSSALHQPGCVLRVINSDLSHRGRVLQYANTELREFSPGDSIFFSGRIRISGGCAGDGK